MLFFDIMCYELLQHGISM